MTPEAVAKMMADGGIAERGTMMLFHGERPVGVVVATPDEYDGLPAMEIGPLAIIPEYQGKGLGRALLRASGKSRPLPAMDMN